MDAGYRSEFIDGVDGYCEFRRIGRRITEKNGNTSLVNRNKNLPIAIGGFIEIYILVMALARLVCDAASGVFSFRILL